MSQKTSSVPVFGVCVNILASLTGRSCPGFMATLTMPTTGYCSTIAWRRPIIGVMCWPCVLVDTNPRDATGAEGNTQLSLSHVCLSFRSGSDALSSICAAGKSSTQGKSGFLICAEYRTTRKPTYFILLCTSFSAPFFSF